jgi:outer membrane biosynthesis protein TonB
MVVTKVAFDMEAESPKLTFKPVGLLDDDGWSQVQETIGSDVVSSILGTNPAPAVAKPVAEVDDEEEAPKPVKKAAPEPEEEAPKPVKKAKPAPVAEEEAPKPVKKAAVVEATDDIDFDLDGINFDD